MEKRAWTQSGLAWVCFNFRLGLSWRSRETLAACVAQSGTTWQRSLLTTTELMAPVAVLGSIIGSCKAGKGGQQTRFAGQQLQSCAGPSLCRMGPTNCCLASTLPPACPVCSVCPDTGPGVPGGLTRPASAVY